MGMKRGNLVNVGGKKATMNDVQILSFNLTYDNLVSENKRAEEDRNRSLKSLGMTNIGMYRIIDIDDDKIYLKYLDEGDMRIRCRTIYPYLTFYYNPLTKIEYKFSHIMYELCLSNSSKLKQSLDTISSKKERVLNRIRRYGLSDDLHTAQIMCISLYNIVTHLFETLNYENFITKINNVDNISNKYDITVSEHQNMTDNTAGKSIGLKINITKAKVHIRGNKFHRYYDIPDSVVSNIYLYMYLDICLKLKVTPFRYLCNPAFLEHSLQNCFILGYSFSLSEKSLSVDFDTKSSASIKGKIKIRNYMNNKTVKIPFGIKIKVNLDKIMYCIKNTPHTGFDKDSFIMFMQINKDKNKYLMKDIAMHYDSFLDVLANELNIAVKDKTKEGVL